MKRRFRRFGPALFALAAATALPALPARAAEFEKSVAVPKVGRTGLGWTSGGCSVRGVSLGNSPNADDIRRARHEDPSDTSWLWWDFHVENRGSGKCRISLTVDVYDRSGRVVKSEVETDTVDNHEHKLDDNIRISTRMRTRDIVDSPRASIRGEIRPR